MSEPERLSRGQLETLESLLEDQRAPIMRRLRPGASAESLADVASFIGRPLPQELCRWWEWHDGTDALPDEPARECSIGTSFYLQRTKDAIEATRERRDMADEIA